MALGVASRAYVMEVGRIALEGEAERLRADPEVQRAYLGRDPAGERESN